ncbi:MAG: AzlD domain-containing protein [Candidatus Faecousia sp.]|nr:AzlD domain-containing protein [Candidatus Faecousia sp.]
MSIYVYIFAMALTTYLIRVLPLTIFRKPIRSRFLRSFLHYVPYACLTAMTFPAILSSTASILSGAAALIVAILLAYRGKSLIVVAVSSSAAVLITQGILTFLGMMA